MLPETRSYPSSAFLDTRGGRPKIVGYAAVFNTLSRPMPLGKPDGRTFREIVRPGAFAASLASGREVFARAEHRDYLARTSNGTLRLAEDHRGLRYEIDPPDTRAGRDVVALIRRRDVPESSFAFRVKPGGDSWRNDSAGLVRELRSLELLDLGPTALGAYAATDVALRSFEEWAQATGFDLWRMRLELAEHA